MGIEYRPELESQPNMSFHLKERYFRYLFAYEQQLTADAPFQEEAIKTYVHMWGVSALCLGLYHWCTSNHCPPK